MSGAEQEITLEKTIARMKLVGEKLELEGRPLSEEFKKVIGWLEELAELRAKNDLVQKSVEQIWDENGPNKDMN